MLSVRVVSANKTKQPTTMDSRSINFAKENKAQVRDLETIKENVGMNVVHRPPPAKGKFEIELMKEAEMTT